MTASPLPRPAEPLVIVGAGPIGLAAAAQAHSRGLPTLVLEAGRGGASVRDWGHVRLFSAWSELVDPVAEKLLAGTGWDRPDPDSYPTGTDWAEQYLAPLAAALGATDRGRGPLRQRVVGVAKRGRDRLVDSGREEAPFTVHVRDACRTGPGSRPLRSSTRRAPGTGPNPLGGDGLPAIGEDTHAGRIAYDIPDFTDPQVAARYAGKHVAVAGTGASAQNTLVGLSGLADQPPGTTGLLAGAPGRHRRRVRWR